MQRTIKTRYYSVVKTARHINVEPIWTNSSSDANKAVAQCVYHMQINHYGAPTAEVYDAENGQLHAVVKRHMDGNIEIVYKRKPEDYERKIAMGYLLDGEK